MLPLRPDEGTSQQVTLGANSRQICNARKNRCGVKVTNLSTADIYIGWNNSVTTSSGDLLLGGKGNWIFLPTESAIWAAADVSVISNPIVSVLEIL